MGIEKERHFKTWTLQAATHRFLIYCGGEYSASKLRVIHNDINNKNDSARSLMMRIYNQKIVKISPFNAGCAFQRGLQNVIL